MHAAITAQRDDSRAATASEVTEEQVAAVRLARWQAWRQVAHTLPDGHVLSAELLHSSVDEQIAVLTVVKGEEPVQYVVASDSRALTSVASDQPSSANRVALGDPPIKEPPQPGVINLGTSLLAAAFGGGQ